MPKNNTRLFTDIYTLTIYLNFQKMEKHPKNNMLNNYFNKRPI